MKTMPLISIAFIALLLGGCVEYNDRPLCEPNACQPNGTCINGDDGPYCKCDKDSVPGDNLTCIPRGGELQVGDTCIDDADCVDGRCLKYTGDTEGYCTTTNCSIDSECVNHATGETAEMCCVEAKVGNALCMKIAEGYSCGDGTGTCGASCTGTADSACAIDYSCLRSSDTDPMAICSTPCATDADCWDCEWSKFPETKIRCVTISGGDKYCLVAPCADCQTSLDCSEGNTCSIGVSPDMSELLGECMNLGALSPGSTCNDEDDPNDLSYEERCSGFYCFGGKCSELCVIDIDCPEGMRCLEHTIEGVDDSITVCKGY